MTCMQCMGFTNFAIFSARNLILLLPIALVPPKLLPRPLLPKTLVYLVLMPKLSLVGTPSSDDVWFCCCWPQLLGCLLNRRGDGGAFPAAVDPLRSKLENWG